MSCLLFHGPGAQEYALEEAHCAGRLLSPPLGEDGLKVEDARNAVQLLMSTPVGSRKGVVVLGPMDLANWKASDVLLKSIEEFNNKIVQPILWAWDIGGVSGTIRSRCLDRWCPKAYEQDDDDEILAAGFDLMDYSQEGEVWRIPGLVKKFAGKESELVGALSEALSGGMHEESIRDLWVRLRSVARHRKILPVEIVSVLVSGCKQ